MGEAAGGAFSRLILYKGSTKLEAFVGLCHFMVDCLETRSSVSTFHFNCRFWTRQLLGRLHTVGHTSCLGTRIDCLTGERGCKATLFVCFVLIWLMVVVVFFSLFCLSVLLN